MAQSIFENLPDANIVAAVDALEDKVKRESNYAEIYAHMVALSQAIFVLYKNTFVYAYPHTKSIVLSEWHNEWKGVIDQFQDTIEDIFSGIDLWALGHNTASVFHMMRVLEVGLGWIALEVGIVFETQNWQNIIEQVESKIRETYRQKNSQQKQEKLAFLSKAAKEFFYFKDGWRNYVSHNRGSYDENQAKSVLDHVRSFMTILAVEKAKANP